MELLGRLGKAEIDELDHIFILEAYEYIPEFKRYQRACKGCYYISDIPFEVYRLISLGYKVNLKPWNPDEFWSKNDK